ncbi:PhzF family phenazine biosynthesis protein [Sporomusa sphaeroides]|uniref:Isomerase YddE n=1 Tax=Sporomusa sphaeroides DSM 2875 TaxID=1337886 RepID=A0ABP2C3B3_9FIRM|nr:PhzF family phenazine biosynthesis protein [Sporomusa sphaeroides]OLS56621.1 putative isomerase YddE [Sporomusa sphaeroides DSM 2875]CVK19011.1 putative isomerase YddE [Sporomusa sphaeroides DSM 2875]
MKVIPIYYVDAFTKECFTGNPAAVCVLTESIEDKYMQLIAKETNLSETAFVQPLAGQAVHQANRYSLRWFTPKCEVDLCGHATIATSKILFNRLGINGEQIIYETKSGRLTARKTDQGISLDFPIDDFSPVAVPAAIIEAMGIESYENAIIGNNTKKLVICVKTKSDVLKLTPDFEKMKNIEFAMTVKGVGVTCSGDEDYDCISRYFNPWAGINEDPVTGSVHTVLAAYWSKLLKKSELRAYQASDRGGEMVLRILTGNRVELIGQAVVVLKGELYI